MSLIRISGKNLRLVFNSPEHLETNNLASVEIMGCSGCI